MFNVKREVSVRFYLMVGFALALQAFGAIPAQAAAPTVSSVSPLTATLNQKTTFTVYGSNLTDDLKFWMDQCPTPVSVYNSGTTSKKFECTPSYSTGSKRVDVKDRNSNLLKTTYVTVVAAPIVNSVSPLTATLNKKTTFTVYGSNLTDDLKFWMDECSTPVSVYNSGTTSKKFECTPSYSTGSKRVDVKDKNSNLLKTTYVTVVAPAPTVSSVSPLTATLNQKTTFTVYGSNLTNDIQLWMDECAGPTIKASTDTTSKQFECTPSYSTGSKRVDVKDKNSNLLKTTYITVAAPAPTVSSVSPLTATLNQKTTFTVYGANLTNDIQLWIGECANTTIKTSSSTTTKQFECTPSFTPGNKEVHVKDKAGNYLKTATLTVVNPLPIITSVTPSTVTLGERTTFTISGSNLTSAMTFWLDECKDPSGITGNSTTKQVQCTPFFKTGQHSGKVVDGTAQKLLNVNFSSPITDTTFDNAVLNSTMTITVTGQYLPSDLLLELDSCAGLAKKTGVSSMQQWTCTPTGIIGNHAGRLFLNPGGTVETFEVVYTNATPAPVSFTKITPQTATLDQSTQFTITGSGFTQNTAVFIERCAAGIIQLISANELTYTCTPIGVVGINNGGIKAIADGGATDFEPNNKFSITVVHLNICLNGVECDPTQDLYGDNFHEALKLGDIVYPATQQKPGALQTVNDEDYFEFSVLEPTIVSLQNYGENQVAFEIFDENFQKIDAETGSAGSYGYTNGFKNLLGAGDYFVKVSRNANFIEQHPPVDENYRYILAITTTEIKKINLTTTGNGGLLNGVLTDDTNQTSKFQYFSFTVSDAYPEGTVYLKSGFGPAFELHLLDSSLKLLPESTNDEFLSTHPCLMTKLWNNRTNCERYHSPWARFPRFGKGETAGNDPAPMIKKQLIAGTYYLRLDFRPYYEFISSIGNPGIDESPFSLFIHFKASGEYIKDLHPETSPTIVNPNDFVIGEFDSHDDIDLYKIVLPHAGKLLVHSEGSVMSRIQLLNSNQQSIFSEDTLLGTELFWPELGASDDPLARLHVEIPAGTYYLKHIGEYGVSGWTGAAILITKMLGTSTYGIPFIADTLTGFYNTGNGAYLLKLSFTEMEPPSPAPTLTPQSTNGLQPIDQAVLNMLPSDVVNDYAQKTWYVPYLAGVWKAGIIGNESLVWHSFNDGRFDAGATVTRIEMARWVYAALGGQRAPCIYSQFPDVSAGSWDCAAVSVLSEKGIMQGPGVGSGKEGLFDPEGLLNRAEAAKIISVAFGIQAVNCNSGNPFPDVSSTQWYCPYVQALKNHTPKIIEGYADGSFHPADTLKRDQIAKMLQLATQVAIPYKNTGSGIPDYDQHATSTQPSTAIEYTRTLTKQNQVVQVAFAGSSTDATSFYDQIWFDSALTLKPSQVASAANGNYVYQFELPNSNAASYPVIVYLADNRGRLVTDYFDIVVNADGSIEGGLTEPTPAPNPGSPTADYNNPQMMTFVYEYQDGLDHLVMTMEGRGLSYRIVADVPGCPILSSAGTDTRWVYVCAGQDAMDTTGTLTFNGPTGPMLMYNFAIKFPIAPPPEDDFGNTSPEATLLTVGQVVNGSIAIPGDVDVFTFVAPTYGQYRLNYESKSNASVRFQLFRQPIEETISGEPGLWLQNTSRVVDTFFQAGEPVYFRVSVNHLFSTPTTGDYSIKLSSLADDDYYDGYNIAYEMTLAETLSGVIEHANDTDYFKFVPAESGEYTITYENSPGLLESLYITDPYVRDFRPGFNVGAERCAYTIELQQGVAYYLSVRSADSVSFGPYALTIRNTVAMTERIATYTATIPDANGHTILTVSTENPDIVLVQVDYNGDGVHEQTAGTYRGWPAVLPRVTKTVNTQIKIFNAGDFEPAFTSGYILLLADGLAHDVYAVESDIIVVDPPLLPIPLITSVLPTSAMSGIKTTFYVTGDHLPETLEMSLNQCLGVTEVSASETEHAFECTPSFATGAQTGVIKDVSTGQVLFEFTVMVNKKPSAPSVTPVVLSVTPDMATIDERTTFVVTGTDLPTTLSIWIPDCSAMTALGGTTTTKSFECTPSGTTGTKTGTVKNSPEGAMLSGFTVTVVSPAPTVTAIVPLWATLDHKTIFTVNGANLPSTMQITIADCVNPTYLPNTSTTFRQFSCTPSYTAGDKALELRDINGNLLKSATITVYSPAPRVDSISPLTATLDQRTTFTVNGAYLTDTLTYWIADCSAMTDLGGTTTSKSFECTPSGTTGVKPGMVKSAPAGEILSNFTVTVGEPVDPLTAAINNAPRIDLYQEYTAEIVTPGQQVYYVLPITEDTAKNTLHEFYSDPLVSCVKVYDLTLTIFTADDVLDACEAFANPLLRNNEFIPQAGHEYLFITRLRDASATGTYTFGSEEMSVIVVDDPIITPLPVPEPEPEPEPEPMPEPLPEPEPTELLATYTVSLQPGNSRFEVVAQDGLTMLAEVDLNNDGVADISFGASPGFFATTIPLTVDNPHIRVMQFPGTEPEFTSGFVPLLADGLKHQLFQEELFLPFIDAAQPTPVMYTPPTEEEVLEEPVLSEPDLAEPIVDDSQTNEPVAGEPVLAIEESMTSELPPEEPIADEYTVNEPIMEEAVVEEQPVVEPPPADAPPAEVVADEPPTQENPPAAT